MPLKILGLSLLLICYALNLSSENPLTVLKNNYTSEKEKVDALDRLAAQSGICRELHSYYFPDKASLLTQLGADSYEEREHATQLLMMNGEKVADKILSLYKSTKDPEIKARTKEILQAFKSKKSSTDAGMNDALYIILKSPENSPGNIDFLEYYFAKFADIGERLQEMLDTALKKAAGSGSRISPLVENLMIKEKDSAKFALFERRLKDIDSDNYQECIARIKAWNAVEKLNIDEISAKFGSRHSHSSSEIVNLSNKLTNIPNFNLIKDAFIRKYLFSKKPLLVTLSIYLTSDNPAPYVKDIIKMLKISETDDYRHKYLHFIEWAISCAGKKKKLFSPYVEFFLDYPYNYYYTLGLSLIDDPLKYKKRIMDDIVNMSGHSANIDFIIKNFPEEHDTLLRMIIQKIKKQGNTSRNSIFFHSASFSNFSHKLKTMNYKGSDFDQWALAKLAENPDIFQGSFPSTLMNLHISPDIIAGKIVPSWLKKKNKNCIYAEQTGEYLLKCSPKNRQKVLKLIYNSYMNSPVLLGNGLITLLLNNTPEHFDEMIKAVFRKIDDLQDEARNNYHYFLKSLSKSYAAFLREHPEKAEVLYPYLKADNKYIRFTAAAILMHSGGAGQKIGEEAMPASAIAVLDDKKILTWVLSSLLSIKPLPVEATKKTLILILDLFDKDVKDSKYYSVYGSALQEIDSSDKMLLPVLENYIMTKKKLSPKVIQSIVSVMLRVDKKNNFALNRLRKIIFEKPPAQAIKALDILTECKVEIMIPEEKFKNLKLNAENISFARSAVKNSDLNIPNALPLISNAARENQLDSWPMWFLMKNSKKLADALFPVIMESYLKKNYTSKKLVNILKWFPARIKKYIPQIEARYNSLNQPAEIDYMTYLIAHLEPEDAGRFYDKMTNFYRNAPENRKILFYCYAAARIAQEKKEREKNAREFINYITKNPQPKERIGYPIVDAGRILEFPQIVHPMLKKMLDSSEYAIRERAIWGLASGNPYSNFTITIFTEIINDFINNGKYRNRFGTLIRTLKNDPDNARLLLPALEKIPEDKRSSYGLKDFINQLQKTSIQGTPESSK
jgi:hypothetical protein